MTAVVERLDDLGRPAWIAVMVLGFILFWPVGLLILGYLIWSGRMGCGRHDGSRFGEMSERWGRKMRSWGGDRSAFRPTGNRAFDEYRDETLKRLEEEASEFRSFLERLRMARDKSEFDQYMAERRAQGSGGPEGGQARPV